jgi:TolB-like protein/tetratricopeptide (TPR) repeat protein/class 3 adenylate cyclase
MGADATTDPKFEIGHVLFIDIVGYSKLLIGEQSELVRQLKEVVATSQQVRVAEEQGRLVSLPTGDGIALVFRDGAEAPAKSALEIARAINKYPKLRLRMGIHSGPVNVVTDLNNRANVAGAGINIAQRVMDCGDAGHILLSKHVAEDLEHYARWRPYLHELGECEVKHGARISLVNLYGDSIGNADIPEEIRQARREQARASRDGRKRILVATSIVVAAVLGIAYWVFHQRRANDFGTVPVKSIAVLPFQNLSPDPQNVFFADGVQDEILTNLARIADLKVISRTSVMQYKPGIARNARAIGQALGVANLLEGSVQREGGKVRVNAQLIDTRNDTHVWAQTYDRDLADIFAIQTEIATKIVDQLRAKISPSEKNAIETPPTRDLTAYDLFIRAQALSIDLTNQLVVKEKAPQAIRLLEEAVARDPNFTRAFCLLSRIQGQMFWAGFDHTPARLALAKQAAEAALRTAPDDGDAHLAMADYYYHGFRDYQQARKELSAARQTLPNNPQVFEYSGYIERRQGDWASATRDFERSIELDPRNFHTIHQLALTYQLQHRYKDQLRTLDRALTIVPDDLSTLILRAWIPADWRADLRPFQQLRATLVGKDPAAANDIEDINYALCERMPDAISRTLAAYPADGNVYNGIKFPRAYWEGVIARWRGEKEKASLAFTDARRQVEDVVRKQPDFPAALTLLGLIDAGLERKDDALREARRACELLPIAADAVDGVAYAANLAQVYIWTGEKDLALDQLENVERVPNLLSYGYLKLQPVWDPLRGDSHFEKLLASLAPKD